MTVAVAHRSTQRIVALVVAAFLACAFTLWATSAKAHSELEESNPAEGASVASLSAITLTFGEGITPEFSTYTLTDSMAMAVKLGTPTYDVTKTIVTIPLTQMIGGGAYTIGYSVLSVDGHKVAGSVHFTSTAEGMGPGGHDMDGDHSGPPPSGMPRDRDHDHDGFGPGAGGSTDNDSGKAIWYALGGALLGAVIVAVIAWLIRRRRVSDAGTQASAEPATESDAVTLPETATTSDVAPVQDKPKRSPKKSDD